MQGSGSAQLSLENLAVQLLSLEEVSQLLREVSSNSLCDTGYGQKQKLLFCCHAVVVLPPSGFLCSMHVILCCVAFLLMGSQWKGLCEPATAVQSLSLYNLCAWADPAATDRWTS
jgi:hypothetical protein